MDYLAWRITFQNSEHAARSAFADVKRIAAENTMLRQGDTCARQCEGTAYRIELCRLRADVMKVLPVNWREDPDWVRLLETHNLTPNEKINRRP